MSHSREERAEQRRQDGSNDAAVEEEIEVEFEEVVGEGAERRLTGTVSPETSAGTTDG
ncbi:hypothetical protein [Microbacterium sp.]|uniref:hypothetical protein n=1 Tax=Microbacterium sp. TaxID=51671 RepID=UPI0025CEE219|nr:hypothetical protein [Microbacterium sp.]MBT9608162.1 hypothetical protein [Microbacterium sp.]